MNLLLLSLNTGIICDFLSKGSSVGFVSVAGEVYDDPYFVMEDRTRLLRLGYNLREVDITNGSPVSVRRDLTMVDALFVAGGNVFYLMQQLQTKELTETFVEFIESDRLYVGASAGAAICGPSLLPYVGFDDPDQAPGLRTMTGLCVVDFVVLPHYGKVKYLDKYHDTMKDYAQTFRLVPLRDDEAIVVSGSESYQVRRSASVPIDGG